jgi:hypothetical protein
MAKFKVQRIILAFLLLAILATVPAFSALSLTVSTIRPVNNTTTTTTSTISARMITTSVSIISTIPTTTTSIKTLSSVTIAPTTTTSIKTLPPVTIPPVTTTTSIPAVQILTNATLNNTPSIPAFVFYKGPLAYAARGSGFYVIDTTTYEVVRNVSLDLSVDSLALSKDDSLLYVSGSKTRELTLEEGYGAGEYVSDLYLLIFNTSTNDLVKKTLVTEGFYPSTMTAGPDGKIYLSAVEAGNGGPMIYIIKPGSLQIDYTLDLTKYDDYPVLDLSFSPDGSKVYLGFASDYSRFFVLDWAPNLLYKYSLYPHNDGEIWYLSAAGSKLYLLKFGSPEITYFDTITKQLQSWNVTYRPLDLAASQDGTRLYVLGYNYDAHISAIYRYSGLKTVDTSSIPFVSGMDYIVSNPSFFYSDSNSNVIPLGSGHPFALRLTISPDGKYLYIQDSASIGLDASGDAIVVYDAETLQQVAKIPAKDIVNSGTVAIGKAAVPWLKSTKIIDFTADLNLPHFSIIGPSVGYTEPEPDSTYWWIDEPLHAYFTDKIDPATINSATFVITDASTSAQVSGKYNVSGKNAYFTPSSNLKPKHQYSGKLTTGIKDENGNPLPKEYSWTFSTSNHTLHGGAPAESNAIIFKFSDLTGKGLIFKQGINLQLVNATTTIPVQMNGTSSTTTVAPSSGGSGGATPGSLGTLINTTFGSTNSSSAPGVLDNLTDNSLRNQPGEASQPAGGNEIQKPGDPGWNQLNPQPEPPAPAISIPIITPIFDAIMSFFRGLFSGGK